MKALIHINSGKASKKSELFGNLKNLREDSRIQLDDIKVVINSEAVEMALEGSASEKYLKEDIEKGVDVKICSNSVQNMEKANEKDLIDGVELVESGIGTVNLLQEKDYNYTKI